MLTPFTLKWYVVFVVNPDILALTFVLRLPLTVAGTPGTVVPYAAVRPYSKETVVDVLLALIIPFNVARTFVTLVAALVVTVGGMAAVVKVISPPQEFPAELTPHNW
jgi:hypothetical protein